MYQWLRHSFIKLVISRRYHLYFFYFFLWKKENKQKIMFSLLVAALVFYLFDPKITDRYVIKLLSACRKNSS